MQADESKYPANISKLFEPKPPLVFKEPTDVDPSKRRTKFVAPISGYLALFQDYDKDYVPSEGLQRKQQRLRKEKIQLKNELLRKQLHNWDPLKDGKINANDPYRTLFVARLDYNIGELDLQKIFNKYGMLENIKIIRDLNGKSKGYGFVVFERENDMKLALNETDGLKLNNRPILVDIERSRIIKTWKPRRLGGGLGGRHYTKPKIYQQERRRERAAYPPREVQRPRPAAPRDTYRKDSDRYNYQSRNSYGGERAQRYDDRDFKDRERDSRRNDKDMERERERERNRLKRIQEEKKRGAPRAY